MWLSQICWWTDEPWVSEIAMTTSCSPGPVLKLQVFSYPMTYPMAGDFIIFPLFPSFFPLPSVESALKPNNHFEVDVVLKDPRNKRFAWNEKLVAFQSSTFWCSNMFECETRQSGCIQQTSLLNFGDTCFDCSELLAFLNKDQSIHNIGQGRLKLQKNWGSSGPLNALNTENGLRICVGKRSLFPFWLWTFEPRWICLRWVLFVISCRVRAAQKARSSTCTGLLIQRFHVFIVFDLARSGVSRDQVEHRQHRSWTIRPTKHADEVSALNMAES